MTCSSPACLSKKYSKIQSDS
ncbi:hypothetical protein Zm00014a_021720 [Zea mays]|uniref:Uncharacterized protein n=1 Tax=Zea mays TaxID=4577 RepID=A0A3L6FFA7_MAIZE|nr:hypothetical protein Zm00014a_021720 [Zea mays]